jgi:hypothetical protein
MGFILESPECGSDNAAAEHPIGLSAPTEHGSEDWAFQTLLRGASANGLGGIILWERTEPAHPWARMLCLWLLMNRPALDTYRATLALNRIPDPSAGVRFLDYFHPSVIEYLAAQQRAASEQKAV